MHPERKLALISFLATDRGWDALVMVGRALLDEYYPLHLFKGVSGDTGPQYVVALREALRRIEEE